MEKVKKTANAPNPIAPTNQVWQWKEAFNFVGVIGFAMFLCSFTTLLVFTPTFASLRADKPVEAMPVKDKKGKLWFWLSLLAGAVFGTVIYRES